MTQQNCSLFSTNVRTFFGPASMSEAQYAYVDRSARPEFLRVREVWQSWFERYPAADKKDLSQRFKSPDDNVHLPAVFELYCHELLLRLGCAVEVHAEKAKAGKTRDFLVTVQDENQFYLEAKFIASEGEIGKAKFPNEAELVDKLNAVPNRGYGAILSIDGTSKNALPVGRIAKAVDRHLDSIVNATDSANNIPSFYCEYGGVAITLKFLQKSNESFHRLIAGGSVRAGYCDQASRIRKAIKKKSNKYRANNILYVVAINASSFSSDVEGHAEKALFGDVMYPIVFSPHALDADEPEVRVRRDHNGVWFGRNKLTNTSLSAVLLVPCVNTNTVTRCQPRLYLNPWAKHPLPENSPLLRLPRAEAGDNGRLRYVDGAKAHELFGLPPEWPKA